MNALPQTLVYSQFRAFLEWCYLHSGCQKGNSLCDAETVCVMQEPVVPMSFLRAKPIGVMPMIDQGEQDDKIIAVHADDPEFKGYSDISELPKHRLMEIKRYSCIWEEMDAVCWLLPF